MRHAFVRVLGILTLAIVALLPLNAHASRSRPPSDPGAMALQGPLGIARYSGLPMDKPSSWRGQAAHAASDLSEFEGSALDLGSLPSAQRQEASAFDPLRGIALVDVDRIRGPPGLPLENRIWSLQILGQGVVVAAEGVSTRLVWSCGRSGYDAAWYDCARYEYDGSAPLRKHRKFRYGLECHKQAGLSYLGNRWYDPETGSFVSADPLGFPDSMNQYAWGVGNYWKADPLGLQDGAGMSPGEDATYAFESWHHARSREDRAIDTVQEIARGFHTAGEIATDFGPGIGVVKGFMGLYEEWQNGNRKGVYVAAGAVAGSAAVAILARRLARLRRLGAKAVNEIDEATLAAERQAAASLNNHADEAGRRQLSRSLELRGEAGLATVETDAVAASSLLGRGDRLVPFAAKVKPQSGVFDVIVHGTPDHFEVLHNGKWVTIDQRRLATFMKSAGYQGGEVRLLSCKAGACPTGVAQDLANKLNANVSAPSDTLWIWNDGSLVIGPNKHTNTGRWEQFRPMGPAKD